METAKSDESANRSEEAELVQMFDSDTPNQLTAKRKRRQRKKRQYRNSKGAEKGRMSRQADRKGRGARVRREARRNQSDDPEEPEEPQVELEGECSESSSTSAGSTVQAENRIDWDRSVRPNRCVDRCATRSRSGAETARPLEGYST